MPILDALGDYFGVPSWFAGGFLGLVVLFIVLIIMGKLGFRSPAPPIVLFALIILFITILSWPIWVPIIVGVIVFTVFVEKRLMAVLPAGG